MARRLASRKLGASRDSLWLAVTPTAAWWYWVSKHLLPVRATAGQTLARLGPSFPEADRRARSPREHTNHGTVESHGSSSSRRAGLISGGEPQISSDAVSTRHKYRASAPRPLREIYSPEALQQLNSWHMPDMLPLGTPQAVAIRTGSMRSASHVYVYV